MSDRDAQTLSPAPPEPPGGAPVSRDAGGDDTGEAARRPATRPAPGPADDATDDETGDEVGDEVGESRPATPSLRHRVATALRARRTPIVLSLLATAVYTLVAVVQWRSFVSPSWDLGIFTQLAQAYSRFEAPIVPIKGDGFNLLGDHFHPVLVLLGPIYALFPSGLTLLVVQAVLVGVSVYPITSVAVEWLGRRAGAIAGAAYAFSFGIQGAVAAQFHEIAFALPLLGFGLASYLRGRHLTAALWLGGLVFVKEDLGLTVLVLGFVMALRADRRIGAALAAWGTAWFVLATWVILPALNPRDQWDYTDRLVPIDVVGDPLGTLAAFFSPGEKVVTLLLLAAAAGIVGLRSPLMFAMVPTLAWRFLGEVHYYWGWTWHYNAVLMPIAAAALLEALGPAPEAEGHGQGEGRGQDAGQDAWWGRRPSSEAAHGAGSAVRSSPAQSSQSQSSPAAAAPIAPDGSRPATADRDTETTRPSPAARQHRLRTRIALVAAALAVLLPARDLPVLQLLSADTYRQRPHHVTTQQVLDLIPTGVTVASDIGLLAYLVPDRTALWTGTADNPVPDYIVLDDRVWSGNPPEDAVEYAISRYPGTQWETLLENDGYRVLRLDVP